MKKSLSFFIMAMILGISLSLTSCIVDYGPGGYGNYSDSRLTGFWQLVQVNGVAITGTNVNYMYFNGQGNGNYYYFQNNRRYTERLQYWCTASNGYYQDYELNILYQYSSSPTSMTYWFTNGGNALYMQWYENGRPQTYLYTRYPGAPW